MTSWIGFLKEQHEVLTNSPQTLWITSYNWVETVVRDGILPALKQAGYSLNVEPSGLASCILNVLYRHQYDYQKGRFTHYRCCHGRVLCHPPEGSNVRLEDQIEYFHELLNILAEKDEKKYEKCVEANSDNKILDRIILYGLQ
jgi:hypothetical protein